MKVTQVRRGLFDRFMRFTFRAKDIVLRERDEGNLKIREVLMIYYESLRKFLPLTGLILSVTCVATVVGIIAPTYYKDFFDVTGRGLSTDEAAPLMFRAILVVLALDLLGWVARRVSMFGLIVLAKRMMVDLRIRAFNHVIRHSYSFYTSTFVGALVQKLGRFQRSYDRLADSAVYHILPTIVTLVGVMVVLLRESPPMALAMCLWILVLVCVNYFFARWKLQYDIHRAGLDSRVTGQTADMFTNQATIEAHGTYELERERHAKVAREQMHVAAFTWNAGTMFHAFQELSIFGIKYVVFAIGIVLWMKGEFSLGMFMLLHAYVFQITDRLWSFSQVIRDIYESFADAKEMAEAMAKPHEIQERANAHELCDVQGIIELNHVHFEYNQKKVIDDVCLTVKQGERIALVGPSGAGKSTLVKLVSRMFEPKSGEICIDGHNIKDLTILSLKTAISSVPQDPSLFHRTLMENIRYGNPSATDAEVYEASRLAHCHEFISAHPLGYQALVGERGVKLSGGERQRVAIARAFLKNAPILILDEATSSLDSGSEHLIQDALLRLMEGRTTIVIAHRLSTIRRMDRILVLDNGRLTEDGSHDELLLRQGVYWKLWTLQQNGFIADADDSSRAQQAA